MLMGVILVGAAAPSRGATEIAPEAQTREAQRLYEQGRQQYGRGELDAALASLEASYKITPAPGLLYNMAQVHRLKQDCARALELYRRFLDSNPTGAARQLAETQVAEMQRCLPAREPAPPSPVTLPIASTILPTPPTSGPLPKPTASLAAIPQPPAAARGHARRATWVWASAAVALALGAGYFALQTADASAQVSDDFRPGTTWGPDGMAAQQRGQLSYELEIGAAAAALVAGGIAGWLAVHRESLRQEARACGRFRGAPRRRPCAPPRWWRPCCWQSARRTAPRPT
jgi:tetratricopeptide (TPR) repeat protein